MREILDEDTLKEWEEGRELRMKEYDRIRCESNFQCSCVIWWDFIYCTVNNEGLDIPRTYVRIRVYLCVWHMPHPVISLRGFKMYMQCHARTRTVNVSLLICISLNWYCDYTTAATIECDKHKVRMGELSAAQESTCKGGWWQKIAHLAWQFNMVTCTCIWEFR